jgi:hypothetical protein
MVVDAANRTAVDTKGDETSTAFIAHLVMLSIRASAMKSKWNSLAMRLCWTFGYSANSKIRISQSIEAAPKSN